MMGVYLTRVGESPASGARDSCGGVHISIYSMSISMSICLRLYVYMSVYVGVRRM